MVDNKEFYLCIMCDKGVSELNRMGFNGHKYIIFDDDKYILNMTDDKNSLQIILDLMGLMMNLKKRDVEFEEKLIGKRTQNLMFRLYPLNRKI